MNLNSAPATSGSTVESTGLDARRSTAVRLAVASSGPGLWRAVRYRWLAAFGGGLLLAGAAAAAVWLKLPAAQYAPFTAQAALIADPSFYHPEDAWAIAAILQSPVVLQNALDLPQDENHPASPKVADLPMFRGLPPQARLDLVKENLFIETSANPDVVRLRLRGERAEDLALTLDAVGRAYKRFAAERERKTRQSELAIWRTALQWHQAERDKKRTEYHERAGSAGPIEWPARAVGELLQTLYLHNEAAHCARLRNELARVEALIEHQRSNPSVTSPSAAKREEAIAKDYLLGELHKQLDALNAHVASIRAALQPERAEDRLKSDGTLDSIKHVEDAIAKRKAFLRGPDDPTTAHTEQRAVLRRQLQEAEATLAEARAEAVRGNTQAQSLTLLRAELAGHERHISEFTEKNAAAETGLATVPPINWLEPAQVPTIRDDRRVLPAAVAGAGVFLVIVLGIGLAEQRVGRVYSAETIRTSTNLKVLGSLPTAPNPASCDAVRALLLQAAERTGARVLLVGSTDRRSDSAAFARPLAACLVQAGRRTLLIDARLRAPSLHQWFELPLEPGLCEVLRDEVEAADVVQPTAESGLWLLSAGRFNDQALGALPMEHVQQAIARLREQFDFVLIDTGPILTNADALLLGRRVDSAILTIQAGRSRLPRVHAVASRLADFHIPVLGAVVCNASGRA